MFYIYILYSETINKYYIGQSQDPWNRLEQHNENTPDKYTGKSKDWTLKAVFEIKGNRSDAVKIEKYIKESEVQKIY